MGCHYAGAIDVNRHASMARISVGQDFWPCRKRIVHNGASWPRTATPVSMGGRLPVRKPCRLWYFHSHHRSSSHLLVSSSPLKMRVSALQTRYLAQQGLWISDANDLVILLSGLQGATLAHCVYLVRSADLGLKNHCGGGLRRRIDEVIFCSLPLVLCG